MRLINRNLFTFANIGFIGLGNMGLPMASNLVKNGHKVFAYDLDIKKEEQAKTHKIIYRPTITQVAKAANIFVMMLPNSEHSVKVCEDPNGLFLNAPPESLIIDCSTISPTVAEALNVKAATHKHTFVDAPVSGGVTGAAAGTLSFMVGARSQNIFNDVKPILAGMGKTFFNCQRPGAGQIAKLCNNMALAIEMIGVSQALALGKKMGIDTKVLTDIMKVSSSRCWSVDTYNPVPDIMPNVPASRSYENGFACQLMLKDLKLAVQAASLVNAKISLGRKSLTLYQKLIDKGLNKKDFSIIYKILAEKKNKQKK